MQDGGRTREDGRETSSDHTDERWGAHLSEFGLGVEREAAGQTRDPWLALEDFGSVKGGVGWMGKKTQRAQQM